MFLAFWESISYMNWIDEEKWDYYCARLKITYSKLIVYKLACN